MKKIVNGKEVILSPEEESAVIAQREADAAARAEYEASLEGVQQKRRNEYPPIGDQLDAIWKGMDLGTIPRVPDFYDPIKAVKDKYPKPS